MKQKNWRKEELDNRIRIKMKEENGVLFSEEEKKRSRLSREGWRCLMLLVALLVILVLSLFFVDNSLGESYRSLAWVARYAMRRMQDLVDYLSGNDTQSAIQNFMMQFFCPVIAGVALSAAGTSFQAVFHNPMASPTLLGIQSGGTMGALVYVLFFYEPMLAPLLFNNHLTYEALATEYHAMTLYQKYGQYFFVLAGCVAVVIMVLLLSKIVGRGKIETIPLMVGGTIFSGAISSVVSLIEYYESVYAGNETVTDTIQSLEAGSFTTVSEAPLLIGFAVTSLVPFLLMFVSRNRLNIIAFGEDDARTLGISVRKERIYFIVLSTLMTASVIAFGGNIAFIGLIMPHLARQVVGNDFRYLLPAACCMGGIFLLLAFDVSYMLNFAVNMGIVVSVAGSAIFTVCMMIYRRRGNADWA